MYKLKNVVTGVIPDLQIPGHIDGALEFCVKEFKKAGVKQVIQIGDLVDHHFISRHPNELDALSPKQEWAMALKELARWKKAFPKVFVARGNHDEIPEKQMKTLGIPSDVFMRPLNDIYGLPDTWVWQDRYVLFKRVIVEHGMGSGGMYGCKNTANKMGCSYVQGHTHAHAAVFNLPRPIENACAMNVGCLMDEDKYNARYAKQWFKVPMSLGCGIIYSADRMEFIPFK